MRTHTWIRITGTVQILTGLLHAASFFVKQTGANEREKKMLELMSAPRDMGAGFTPTMLELFAAFSSSLSLLCLFAGILNWYLSKQHMDRSIMRGVIGINVVIFGLCFGIMALHTFLLPVICTGLIFLSLLLTWSVIYKRQQK